MSRPKKSVSDKQAARIMVYTTEALKEELQEVAKESKKSESEIGNEAISEWIEKRRGGSVMYGTHTSDLSLTGPIAGASILRESIGELSFTGQWKGESWEGRVRGVTFRDNTIEFRVDSRGSGFQVIVGRYGSGMFMAIPSEGVCLNLADDPLDVFYNKEQVSRNPYINRINGISAVYALKSLAEAGILSSSSGTEGYHV